MAHVPDDSRDWYRYALCQRQQSLTVDDFFYEGRFRGGSVAMQRHLARLRDMCKSCPVTQQCDAYADENMLFGFWAGLTEEERKVRRVAGKRARAQSNEAAGPRTGTD